MRLRHTIGFSIALLVISGGAVTKHALAEDQTPPARKHHVAADKPRPVRHVAEHRRRDRTEIRAAGLRRRHHRAVAQCDEDSVRASGGREVGRASWYGGRHLGRRTASGERLDSIHNTAAHRSLPLNSLVRVTNLDNGRSVIARVTDRGPVSHNFLIDLSPSAADELRMKEAGVVPVSVEPVFQAADAAP